jgi:hypothetical protein
MSELKSEKQKLSELQHILEQNRVEFPKFETKIRELENANKEEIDKKNDKI